MTEITTYEYNGHTFKLGDLVRVGNGRSGPHRILKIINDGKPMLRITSLPEDPCNQYHWKHRQNEVFHISDPMPNPKPIVHEEEEGWVTVHLPTTNSSIDWSGFDAALDGAYQQQAEEALALDREQQADNDYFLGGTSRW